jgi:hypothetical protein
MLYLYNISGKWRSCKNNSGAKRREADTTSPRLYPGIYLIKKVADFFFFKAGGFAEFEDGDDVAGFLLNLHSI